MKPAISVENTYQDYFCFLFTLLDCEGLKVYSHWPKTTVGLLCSIMLAAHRVKERKWALYVCAHYLCSNYVDFDLPVMHSAVWVIDCVSVWSDVQPPASLSEAHQISFQSNIYTTSQIFSLIIMVCEESVCNHILNDLLPTTIFAPRTQSFLRNKPCCL